MVWVNLVDPSIEESEALVAQIEERLAESLHAVVRKALEARRTDPSHAFPRLESHFDSYLFGQFHLPTSADDAVAEYLEVTFVATFGAIWSIVRLPSSTRLSSRFLERLNRTISALGDQMGIGDVLGRLMSVIVEELDFFLCETGASVDALIQSVDDLADSRNLSRALKDRMPGIHEHLADIRREVMSLGSVVDQMELILDHVANDQVDLHRSSDDGSSEEIFGRSTEIHLLDTWFQARRLKVLREEQLDQLAELTSRMSVLVQHDELTSGRFMGAIASIMLVPTFIVGMYGMNFDLMPELRWRLGYGSVLVIIVAVTALQLWFFRRRRWI